MQSTITAAFLTYFTFITVTLTSLVAAQTTQTIRYDTGYDVASNSLSTVACSDGTNGLLTKGYTTFGSLPDFPYIGAAGAVETYNSENCGTCWRLTYTPSSGTSYSVVVLAIDHADDGFNISEEALNELTGGQAEAVGTVQATVEQVDASECGLA